MLFIFGNEYSPRNFGKYFFFLDYLKIFKKIFQLKNSLKNKNFGKLFLFLDYLKIFQLKNISLPIKRFKRNSK